jgi:hypothetical protein
MSMNALSWLTCPDSCEVRQQCVDAPQIRPEVGGVDAVVHLRREDVGAVVPHAPRAVELHDRQRLNRVDAQVGEVFHAFEGVEELRDTVGTDVLPHVVAGGEHADVELVDHEIAECWRPKLPVVPGIRTGITDDAVVLGIGPL